MMVSIIRLMINLRLLLLLLLPPVYVYAVQLYPLKRIATPEDVAWAVCWLTHPKTTFTTGVVSWASKFHGWQLKVAWSLRLYLSLVGHLPTSLVEPCQSIWAMANPGLSH